MTDKDKPDPPEKTQPEATGKAAGNTPIIDNGSLDTGRDTVEASDGAHEKFTASKLAARRTDASTANAAKHDQHRKFDRSAIGDNDSSGSDLNFKGESKEDVLRNLPGQGSDREFVEHVAKVVSERSRHPLTFHVYLGSNCTNIGTSSGGLHIDQSESHGDGGGDGSGGKDGEKSNNCGAEWPLTVFDEVENDPGDIAFLLSLASMSRAPLSLIRHASDVLTERLTADMPRKKQRSYRSAKPADALMRKMRCEIFTPDAADDGRPSTARVRFISANDDNTALIDIWNCFRLSPPWQPIYLDWLYEMGCSDHIDLRYAAGRAVGQLATTDLDYFDSTFFQPWADEEDSVGADALGVAFATLCETSTEFHDWVRRVMYEWCASDSLRKHMHVAANVVGGGFGDPQPELAMDILTRMLRSLRLLGFELSYEACYGWLYGRSRASQLSAGMVFRQLETITEKDRTDPVPLLRDQLFLMLVYSYDETREEADAAGFVRMIARDDDARQSAGRMFGRLIQRAPMSTPALACLRSIIEWESSGTAEDCAAVEDLLTAIHVAGAPKTVRILSRRLPTWRQRAERRKSKSSPDQVRVW